MINLKIIFFYRGENYNGWNNKKNENLTSIKYHFKKAFKKITKKKIKFKISSRTDKFVCAKNQVVSCLCKIKKKIRFIKNILNNNLPKDIIIKKIKKIEKEFDAKKNSVYKEYEYKIFNSLTKKNILKTTKIKKKININTFNEFSKYILGENIFENLKSKKCSFLSSIRKIIKIKIKKNKHLIKINIKGNAFCYKMIRIIIGFLVYKSFNKNNNKKITFPSNSLCLNKIFFTNNIKNFKKIKKLITPKFPLNNLIF